MKLKIIKVVLLLSILYFNGAAQNARVQFIHNSPDTSVRYVDIYWNGTLLYNNFVFHRASPFINRTGGVAAIVAIADSSSTSSADAFATFDFTPTALEKYIMLLQGIKDEIGYASYSPFDLKIIPAAREVGLDYATVDMLFVNGSPDAGIYDINETYLLQVPFAQGLSFNQHQDYLSVFAGDYRLRITDTFTQEGIGDFNAPFTQYGLNGKAVTLVTSGFSNPEENSNGELIGMWMARAEGGMMTQYPSTKTSLRLIHNSADVTFSEVDVYWNNKKIIDDLPFRNSSQVISRRLTMSNVNIGIAPAGSNSSSDVFYTYTYQPQSADTSLFVLSGLLNTTGYSSFQPLALMAMPHALPPLNDDEVKISFMSSITDLPAFRMNNVDSQVLLVNASYGMQHEIVIPASNQIWSVRNLLSTYEIASFNAALNQEAGNALLVLGSGFYHPEQNNNGADYGFWMDINQGGPLVEMARLEDSFTQVRFFNNSSDALAEEVDIYVNDELMYNSLSFEATDDITVKADADIEIKVVPSGQPVATSIFRNTYHFNSSDNYLLWMDGIASSSGFNPSPELDIKVLANPQWSSGNASETDVLFYNGSSDVGSLSFLEPTAEAPWINTLPFYAFSDSPLSFDGDDNQIMRIASSGGTFVFGHYILPFAASDLAGEAVVVLTHGFWNPVNNSNGDAFSVWLMRADGSLQELEAFDYVGINESHELDKITLYPNPANEFLAVIQNGSVQTDGSFYDVVDMSGRHLSSGKLTGSVDISALSPGMYCLRTNAGVIPFMKQ